MGVQVKFEAGFSHKDSVFLFDTNGGLWRLAWDLGREIWEHIEAPEVEEPTSTLDAQERKIA